MATLVIPGIGPLLTNLQSTDNQLRQVAEQQLSLALKNPVFIVSLLQYIDFRNDHRHTVNDNESTVALAAVLLSRHVPKLWGVLEQVRKEQILSHILTQYSNYKSAHVLQSLAELANTVAQSTAATDDVLWDDLVRLVLRLSQPTGSTVENCRMVSFKLMGMLVDSLGGRITRYYPQFMQGILTCLAHEKSIHVRAAALMSTSTAIGTSEFWDTHAVNFLPSYFDYTWKLIEFAQRACLHTINTVRQGALNTEHSVTDAVAVLTALATNICGSKLADSEAVKANMTLQKKIVICHARACDLCLQILQNISPIQSINTQKFLRACLLLTGSLISTTTWTLSPQLQPFGHKTIGSSPQLVSVHDRGVPHPQPTVSLEKVIHMCVLLAAKMLFWSANENESQVAWSYLDQVDLATEYGDIEGSDAAGDPAINDDVVFATLAALRNILCRNFSSQRLKQLPFDMQQKFQAKLSKLFDVCIAHAETSITALLRDLTSADWQQASHDARKFRLPWNTKVTKQYHLCQAWCLCLASAADSKVATLDIPRLANTILKFVNFRVPFKNDNPMPNKFHPAQALMGKLVSRRGILCMSDLLNGSWSAQESGSHFLCKWMLDLLPSIMAVLQRHGQAGDEAQQSRLVALCGAIFQQQTPFEKRTGYVSRDNVLPATVDDKTACQLSMAFARQIELLVRKLQTQLVAVTSSPDQRIETNARRELAVHQSAPILMTKLLLKAATATTLSLLNISRPNAHVTVALPLLKMLGPHVQDPQDKVLAKSAIRVVSAVLPVFLLKGAQQLPMKQLIALEAHLRKTLLDDDFAAVALGFYGVYVRVLIGSDAQHANTNQVCICLRTAFPSIHKACTINDGSEVKVGSFVRTTLRRAVMTDGLVTRQISLQCLVCYDAYSLEAEFESFQT